jgi:hypothetical protein
VLGEPRLNTNPISCYFDTLKLKSLKHEQGEICPSSLQVSNK